MPATSAPKNGKDGDVEIGANGATPTLSALLRVTNWKIDPKGDAQEVTSMDSAGHKEFIAGNDTYTAQVSARWDPSEAATHGAVPVIKPCADVAFKFYVDKTNLPNEFWSGHGIVTDGPSVDVKHDGVIDYTFSIQGSGELVWPTIPTT